MWSIARDTPNFIANRIGSWWDRSRITVEDGYTIEEVDALTGSLIGLPNSASYRLMDIVGLDVWAHVARNLYESVPNDPWRDRFVLPDFMQKMIERGWLGDKTGQGFYKRVGVDRQIHAIDWKTLEYHPAQKPKFPSVDMARNIEDLPSAANADRAARSRWIAAWCCSRPRGMRPPWSPRFRPHRGNRPRHALGYANKWVHSSRGCASISGHG